MLSAEGDLKETAEIRNGESFSEVRTMIEELDNEEVFEWKIDLLSTRRIKIETKKTFSKFFFAASYCEIKHYCDEARWEALWEI